MSDPRRVEAAVAAARNTLPAQNSLRPMYTSDVLNAIAAALRAYDEWPGPPPLVEHANIFGCARCSVIVVSTGDAVRCGRCREWMAPTSGKGA